MTVQCCYSYATFVLEMSNLVKEFQLSKIIRRPQGRASSVSLPQTRPRIRASLITVLGTITTGPGFFLTSTDLTQPADTSPTPPPCRPAAPLSLSPFFFLVAAVARGTPGRRWRRRQRRCGSAGDGGSLILPIPLSPSPPLLSLFGGGTTDSGWWVERPAVEVVVLWIWVSGGRA
jgi:hypothetical protein